jgi:hypothetical protein
MGSCHLLITVLALLQRTGGSLLPHGSFQYVCTSQYQHHQQHDGQRQSAVAAGAGGSGDLWWCTSEQCKEMSEADPRSATALRTLCPASFEAAIPAATLEAPIPAATPHTSTDAATASQAADLSSPAAATTTHPDRPSAATAADPR